MERLRGDGRGFLQELSPVAAARAEEVGASAASGGKAGAAEGEASSGSDAASSAGDSDSDSSEDSSEKTSGGSAGESDAEKEATKWLKEPEITVYAGQGVAMCPASVGTFTLLEAARKAPRRQQIQKRRTASESLLPQLCRLNRQLYMAWLRRNRPRCPWLPLPTEDLGGASGGDKYLILPLPGEIISYRCFRGCQKYF